MHENFPINDNKKCRVIRSRTETKIHQVLPDVSYPGVPFRFGASRSGTLCSAASLNGLCQVALHPMHKVRVLRWQQDLGSGVDLPSNNSNEPYDCANRHRAEHGSSKEVCAVVRRWWFVCSSDQSETKAEIKCAVIIEQPLVGRRYRLLLLCWRRVLINKAGLKCAIGRVVTAISVDDGRQSSDRIGNVVMCAGCMIDRVATRPCYTTLK